MEDSVKDIISTNCYLPGPSKLAVSSAALKRPLTPKEIEEIRVYIQEHAPFPGCRGIFNGCRKEKTCPRGQF